MILATWNVNGLRARLDFLRHWLADRKPDVVGLQELKLTTEQFPHDELRELGYEVAMHTQKAWNGVAILSRSPAEVTQRGLPGQEDLGARLIAARVAGLHFATVYCPNGKAVTHDDFPLKLSWYDDLRRWLATVASTEEPFIIGGDFNICPQAIDSWNEKRFNGRIFHTDTERERFRGLLDLGLIDLYRAAHGERQEFSWWDYRGGAFHRKQGLRIDFLLGNAAAHRRLGALEIDRDYRKKVDGLTPSDHAPVWAELSDLV